MADGVKLPGGCFIHIDLLLVKSTVEGGIYVPWPCRDIYFDVCEELFLYAECFPGYVDVTLCFTVEKPTGNRLA